MALCPLILISDDDPVVHESLSIYLDAEGYAHQSAYDGEEALRMAESEQPDLMILDLMMPSFRAPTSAARSARPVSSPSSC
jgi:DNA-binding response OmpR family regulator